MDSVVEQEKFLMFGLATLPDNFTLFDYEKQKLWFSSLKKQIKNSDDSQEFVGVSISKEQSLKIDDAFIKLFEHYFPDHFLVIDATNSGLYNKEEFSKITTLKEKLNKSKLMFSENFSYYNFNKVCKANNKLNSWAEEINNLTINGKKLSPLEKFYVAYNYITRFNYHESKTDSYDSRNLINVLNSNDIVCVGYAQMLKALCNKIGIECDVQAIGFNKTELNHMNCQVTIKDEKYGVDGVFYSDPCFDSNTNGKESFSHALISYSDIPKLFVKHWIKFDDKDTYNPSNNITNISESTEEIKQEISEFLYSQRDIFSKYIDDSIKDRKNFLVTKTASKKDIHTIIDKIIDDYLIKVNYGKIKSHFNAFDSPVMDKINMEDLGETILSHTKIKNIDKFKEKIFEEMKSYIPNFDTYSFNRLADAYVRYKADLKIKQIEEKKLQTKDISFENFDKLMQNLKQVEGKSEAFNPEKVDEMIIISTIRANKIWGEFRNGNNPFSMLSNVLTIKVRDEGPSSIKTGEDILELGRERIKKYTPKKENLSNENEQENI